MFPEVKQLWLGFSLKGNKGSGLGIDFARALHRNLNVVFRDFGDETVTRGSHIEKVCLIRDGVGRDKISDFTVNLIKDYLLDFTQTFARSYIKPSLRKVVAVSNARFDYRARVWRAAQYDLSFACGDHVLLTPRDMLTKDETWINRQDFYDRFESIANSVPNLELRSQLNQYLERELRRATTQRQRAAVCSTITEQHPELIDLYIRNREDRGVEAMRVSEGKVTDSEQRFVEQAGALIRKLETETDFYRHGIDTMEECKERIRFLKGEIENNGAYRLFYHDKKPVQREADLQILYRLTWFATPSDFNSEVNNGRGPVDFKISRGSKDKTIVEFKLAKNSKLEQNLLNQVGIYERANRTNKSLKVVFYFTKYEHQKVLKVLRKLKLQDDASITLIDCRADNKPSASNA
jgi:hypothetical protein